MEPLFTREDMFRAANRSFMLPENEKQARDKPRASGIASCARQIAYMMANVPETNQGAVDSIITTEQGRIMEDLSVELINELGFQVINRQITLPADYPLTGHPDGEIVHNYFYNAHSEPKEMYDLLDANGLKWGFEHKHLGRWAYEAVFKRGLEAAEPVYLAQAVAYGDALNWDAVMWVIMAQDASSTRSDATNNLKAKNPAVRWAISPDWNPKYQVFAMDLRPYKQTLAKRIRMRAEWFTKYVTEGKNPDEVIREYDPDTTDKNTFTPREDGTVERTVGPGFPCSHCEWLDRCVAAGQGKFGAPELPMNLSNYDDET